MKVRLIRDVRHRAFTRAELVVILAVLTLLTAIVLPALANTRPRSARVICANNLRQIGMAVQLWGNDFDDQPPWEVPSQLPGAAPGGPGTMQHSLAPNVWLHFAWMSNQLNSARVLLCPSDTGRLAEDFSFSPNGGYLHANYRNSATSYFLTHAFYGGVYSMIAGDRNVGVDSFNSGCSRFVSVSAVSVKPLSSSFRWSTALHDRAGNILRMDGRVAQHSNETLPVESNLIPLSDANNFQSIHLIFPR